MSYSTRVELRNCRRTLFTIFWLGISYRGDPNRKQSILAQKSQQVIYTMIFYQYSNAVCSKVNKVWQQFLSSTRIEFDMKDTKDTNSNTFSWLIFLIFHVKIANSSQFTGFFLSKTQIQIYFLDFSWYITNLDISYYFSCQNLNLNECDRFFLSKIPVFYFWHAVFSRLFLFLNFDLQPFHDFF